MKISDFTKANNLIVERLEHQSIIDYLENGHPMSVSVCNMRIKFSGEGRFEFDAVAIGAVKDALASQIKAIDLELEDLGVDTTETSQKEKS